jgi:hypothetical protein
MKILLYFFRYTNESGLLLNEMLSSGPIFGKLIWTLRKMESLIHGLFAIKVVTTMKHL